MLQPALLKFSLPPAWTGVRLTNEKNKVSAHELSSDTSWQVGRSLLAAAPSSVGGITKGADTHVGQGGGKTEVVTSKYEAGISTHFAYSEEFILMIGPAEMNWIAVLLISNVVCSAVWKLLVIRIRSFVPRNKVYIQTRIRKSH